MIPRKGAPWQCPKCGIASRFGGLAGLVLHDRVSHGTAPIIVESPTPEIVTERESLIVSDDETCSVLNRPHALTPGRSRDYCPGCGRQWAHDHEMAQS